MMSTLKAEVEEHDKTLFGNGHNGLKEDVTVMRERQRLLLWLMGVVAAGVIGQVILSVAEAVH